jgi:hypothetical protein
LTIVQTALVIASTLPQAVHPLMELLISFSTIYFDASSKLGNI